MIVRLSQRQHAVLLELLIGDERYRYWLEQSKQPKSRPGCMDVVMPAIAWSNVMGEIEQMVVGPLGGMRGDADRHAMNARRQIARDLSIMEAHPALRYQAILGTSTLMIPTWTDAKSISIYPGPGIFSVLAPFESEWGNARCTTWHPDHAVKHVGLFDERHHLVFVDFGAAAEDHREVVG